MTLIRWWKLDELSGTTVADQSGNNDTGTYNGGDDISLKTGPGPGNVILKSLTFNGIDDEISNINPTPGIFTLSVWVWPNAIPFPFVGRLNNNNRFIRVHDANTVRVSCEGSSSQTGVSFTVGTISTTGWNHIVVIRDSSNNGRVWVNGIASSSNPQVLGTVSMAIQHIARASVGSINTYFNGKMAWLRLYDSDETANIATLFAEGVVVPPSSFKHFIIEEVSDE